MANIELQLVKKKPLVSFDTVSVKGEDKEVLSLYNVYNQINLDIVSKNTKMSAYEISFRRTTLESIFNNRAKFLIDRILAKYTGMNITLEGNYPYIYDIYTYMGLSIAKSPIMYLTQLICSEVYNMLIMCDTGNMKNIVAHYDKTLTLVSEMSSKIGMAICTLVKEVHDIYYLAGMPDTNIE